MTESAPETREYAVNQLVPAHKLSALAPHSDSLMWAGYWADSRRERRNVRRDQRTAA
jgi:hypothetical protein